MTREQFIDRWKHELAGLMLDAATTGMSGAALALWCRNVMKTLDARLGQMWDSLQPKQESKPAANGAAKPQEVKK